MEHRYEPPQEFMQIREQAIIHGRMHTSPAASDVIEFVLDEATWRVTKQASRDARNGVPGDVLLTRIA